MPSSINLNGLRIYRPGIYAEIDASALGGSGISTGNVALVGEFPSIEQHNPLVFTSARAVQSFDPDDLSLQTLSKLAFSPSTDDRVAGGAGTLTIVNVQPNSQAMYTVNDAYGAASLILKSQLWGPRGNQVFVQIAENPGDSTLLDFVISKGTATETFTGVGSGVIVSFYVESDEIQDSLIRVDTDGINWTWDKQETFAGANPVGTPQSVLYDPVTDLLTYNGSTLSFSIDADGPLAPLLAGYEVSIEVTGLDKFGAPALGTATITEAEFSADPNVTKIVQVSGVDGEWGSLSTVQFTSSQGTFDGTVQLTGTAFDLSADDFNSVGEMAELIDNNSNVGWHADVSSPRINNIPADQMDQCYCSVLNPAGVSTVKAPIYADLWAIVESLSASSIVESSRDPSAVRRPGPLTLGGYSEQFFLVGGTQSATSVADYDDSFEAIEYSDIQIVVPISDDLQVGKKLIAHCKSAAVAGYERNGYFGAPANKTLLEMFTDYTSQLNSRHVAAVGQEVYIENASGALKWYDPYALAILMAGMQAGTSVATPLTFKRPNVFNVRQSWDLNRDANEAISKGILNISQDTLGFRVERSVTTWLQDDNPVYSEVSSNESANTSVRDLRAALQIRIGDAVFGDTASKLRSVVEARLNQQIVEGFIKAWRNARLEDLGDTIKISYEVAVIEPLNFIRITASVVRIAGVA